MFRNYSIFSLHRCAYSPLHLGSSKTQRQRTPADKETHHNHQAASVLSTDILIKPQRPGTTYFFHWKNTKGTCEVFANGFRVYETLIPSFHYFSGCTLEQEQELERPRTTVEGQSCWHGLANHVSWEHGAARERHTVCSASRMLLRIIFTEEDSQNEKQARGGACITKENESPLARAVVFSPLGWFPKLSCITAHVLTWKDCKKELK